MFGCSIKESNRNGEIMSDVGNIEHRFGGV